jgi:hypothetical protein
MKYSYISGFESSQAVPARPSSKVMHMIVINCLYDVARAALGRNFDVTIGRPACEACSATWNSGTNIFLKLPMPWAVPALTAERTLQNQTVRTFSVVYFALRCVISPQDVISIIRLIGGWMAFGPV